MEIMYNHFANSDLVNNTISVYICKNNLAQFRIEISLNVKKFKIYKSYISNFLQQIDNFFKNHSQWLKLPWCGSTYLVKAYKGSKHLMDEI